MTMTIYGMAITLLPILLTFVIASCQSGLGSNKSPISTLQNDTWSIMSISTFLLRVDLLYLFILLFFSILRFAIVLLINSYLINVIGLMNFILLSHYRTPTQLFLEKILQRLPSVYINNPNIIQGGTFLKPLANNTLTFQNGLFVLSIYMVLLFCFSWFVINKRQQI